MSWVMVRPLLSSVALRAPPQSEQRIRPFTAGVKETYSACTPLRPCWEHSEAGISGGVWRTESLDLDPRTFHWRAPTAADRSLVVIRSRYFVATFK